MQRFHLAAALVLVAGCDHQPRELAPIRLQPMGTLGADTGAGAIVSTPSVSALHPRGYRVVIPASGGVANTPAIYDTRGTYLGSLQGGVPADQQFQSPQFTRMGQGDSIWIFDGAQRALVFDADHKYARTVSLPTAAWDSLLLRDGRMVIAPSSENRALPLLLLDAHGTMVREIGANDSGAAALHTPRWIVRSADGTFWSMPMQFRWRIEHWDTAGRLLSVLERTPDWFPPYAQVLPIGPDQPPQATVQGIWVDSHDRLWILGQANDAQWVRGTGRAADGGMVLDPNRVFDTVIETVNLATGRVMAATRIDAAYSAVVEPGVIMQVRAGAGGWKKVDLVRVVLDSSQQ